MKLELRDAIEKYLAAAGAYGRSVPLSSLGLSRTDVEEVFGALDEDYHISRFIHLEGGPGETYQINGFPQTHVSIDPEIQTIL